MEQTKWWGRSLPRKRWKRWAVANDISSDDPATRGPEQHPQRTNASRIGQDRRMSIPANSQVRDAGPSPRSLHRLVMHSFVMLPTRGPKHEHNRDNIAPLWEIRIPAPEHPSASRDAHGMTGNGETRSSKSGR